MKNWQGNIFLVFFLFSIFPLEGRSVCFSPELKKQPIQVDGRIKPISVYAQHVTTLLFPKKMCAKKINPTTVYCLLSLGKLKVLEADYGCAFSLKLDHTHARGLLGLPVGARTVSLEQAFKGVPNLFRAYEEMKRVGDENSDAGIGLVRHIGRIQKFQRIASGYDWHILSKDQTWLPVQHIKKDLSETDFSQLVLGSAQRLNPEDQKRLSYEQFYERLMPFTHAMWICLLGFLMALLSLWVPRFRWGMWGCLGSLLCVEIAGITLRMFISGRAPVTNMYETVMWSGMGLLLLSVILGVAFNNRMIIAVGFFTKLLFLFMMKFATTMLDASIQPLVPVLRDNFWLSTHVTTITLSYGCFALSWVAANFVLIRWACGYSNPAFVQMWNGVIRAAIQIGAVLLVAGIILGGVWADYSWGRFWGWDPKETWSLIAFVVYIAILHGRYVGWFRDIVFTLMSAFGFMFILMTWFGVNYVLASGLHSYGFSSGGTLFLATLLLFQLLIGVWVMWVRINEPVNP